MAQPQAGILPEANPHAIFLTLIVDEGLVEEGPGDALRRVCAAVPDLAAELSGQQGGAVLHSVVAFGDRVWDRFFSAARPAGLSPFPAVADGPRAAPATPADILLHVRGERLDLCFELVRQVRRRLGTAVRVAEEVQGFRYLDSRDLTGFVDGTENPQGEDRGPVALVGDEDAAFAGGSYISVQRYIHDLAKWEALPVPDQERVIARTKADNIEFASADKPPTAHIKRVSLKEDGQSLEMLRHSMPYGTADEHGLYFISYTRRADIFDKMLASMITADAEGHYDHLLDYTRAVTGARFFAPSLEFLNG